jgi:hypothetical protein
VVTAHGNFKFIHKIQGPILTHIINMTNYITLASSIIVGLYLIATGIGNGFPGTKVGKFCLRVGIILGNIEKILPNK